MKLLSEKLHAHLETALGKERYNISKVPIGDGIAAWRVLSGAVDGNEDEQIRHYTRQMHANVLKTQQGYNPWYAGMRENQQLINDIESVKSRSADGELDGQLKHFYMHEDNFKQEYFMPNVKGIFPEVFLQRT